MRYHNRQCRPREFGFGLGSLDPRETTLSKALWLFCGLLLLMCRSTPAENWPMWRGPQGTGVSSETTAPVKWSPSTNVDWKCAIPGWGYSSPVVWEDSIFLTAANVETRERLLYCIDRSTGTIRWTKTVVVAEIEQMHRSNSPASGTPATDGQAVYVMFQAEGRLLVAAYDFDGRLLWRKSPGAFESRHGFNTSPVLLDESLLISGMQDGPDAFVARLDRQTGEVEWKSQISEPVRSFSTPLLISGPGGRQAVLSGANRTFAFAPRDGQLLWTVQGPAQKTVSSVVATRDTVFVPGGRDNLLLAIGLDGRGDVSESHVRWRATKGIPYINSPVLSGDLLHVLSDEGIYSCFDPSSGKLKLQKRLLGKSSSSPVAIGDRLYLTSEDGRTVIISNDGKANVLATNEIGEEVYASLAVSNGELFLRGKSSLFRIRLAQPGLSQTER